MFAVSGAAPMPEMTIVPANQASWQDLQTVLGTRGEPSASRLPNMKEVRPPSAGRTKIRILFVFNPYRSAVLLVAGDRSGQRSRWHRTAIPEAERLYEDYLDACKREIGHD